MARSVPESDWKLLRQLHPTALNRLCQQVLDEVTQIAADTTATPHERYLKIYEVIQERDRTVAEAFNDLRRSTALLQLMTIHSHGLLTEEEIGRFTEDTREVLLRLSAKGG